MGYVARDDGREAVLPLKLHPRVVAGCPMGFAPEAQNYFAMN
jgi:hypothetical protein